MRFSDQALRRMIRKNMLRIIKEQQQTGADIPGGNTREMTANEVAEIEKNQLAAAVAAAHTVAKNNIDNPEKFGLAAYAFTELVDAATQGKDIRQMSGLSRSFVDFVFAKSTDSKTLKDFNDAATEGLPYILKVDNGDAAFSKVAGDTAAAEAKKGAEARENLTKVGAAGKSFELPKNKDAVVRMQKWLSTQPAMKGKKLDADGKYGSQTHQALVAALPDNLPNAANFKKLKFDDLLKDESLREDLADFMVYKDFPWNKGAAAPAKGGGKAGIVPKA